MKSRKKFSRIWIKKLRYFVKSPRIFAKRKYGGF